MNVIQLSEEISRIIQDDSYCASILSFLNQGLWEISGKVLPDGRTIKLPALDSTDTVETDTDDYKVALPTDYHHSLYWVGSEEQGGRIGKIKDYESFRTFLRTWPDPALDAEGNITSVVVRNGYLYYQPRAVDTLTLHYSGQPTELEDITDTPECLPTHLHRPILVNYVCWKIFDEIEDGIDGAKVNATKYERLYNQALLELADFIGSDSEPVYMEDEADSIYG